MINYREKVIELGVSDFVEIKTEHDFTCKLTYQNIHWRQTVKYSPHEEKYKSVHELYARLFHELMMSPKERKLRKAFSDAWLRNVIEGRSDSRGEFVPSNKQIIQEFING